MAHAKSAFIIIGILVAAAMAVLLLTAPFSLAGSVLIFPLLPGMVAGLQFSGHGGNMPIAIFSCWIVDTSLYCGLWTMLFLLIWPVCRGHKL
jgi:hypothetical protein